jgi:hypothetical protein
MLSERMTRSRSPLSIIACSTILAVGLSLLIMTTSAHAQSSAKELSGTYVNREAGVEVTFPDGWAGNISESELQLEGFASARMKLSLDLLQ